MRIGIDVSSAVNQTAGIGRYTNELVKHILKIENSDDYVLHSFFGDTRAFVERHKLKHGQLIDHGFNGKAFRTYLLALKLMGVTPDGLVKGTDVFHIPDFSFPALKTIKSVFTINDLIFLRYPEYFTRQNRIYMKQMSKFSADNAKAIIAISQSTKTDIINYLDIPEDKISVVYLAVGEQFKRADLETIETAKAKFGIDGQYLLYVGTLEPRKNITLLIEAFSIYCSHNKEFPLKLVIARKKGWLYEDIFRRVKELNLDEKVVFSGFVDDDNLPALYSGAEIFIYPSLYEGFGFPVLEAMSCGTPVISSNISSMPEVAGDAAVLVDPNDAEDLAHQITRVIEDKALRNDMIEKGFANVKRFSWDKTADDTLSIYRMVNR